MTRDPIEEARKAYAAEVEATAQTIRTDAVYTRVVAELGARTRFPRWLLVAAPIAVAVIAVFVVSVWRVPPVPVEVVQTRGDVVLTAEAVRVGEGGAVEVSLPGDVRAAMRGVGKLSLARGVTTLEAGQARFAVRSRVGREPYRMRAGDADILVRGTDFQMDVEKGVLTCLRVTEGLVEVRRNGQVAAVPAGESRCPQERSDGLIAMSALPWAPKVVEPDVVSPPEPPSPAAREPLTGAHHVEQRPLDVKDAVTKARAAGNCSRVADLVSGLDGTRKHIADLELAECYMETNAPRKALDVYARIVRDAPSTSTTAETALFEQTRLLSDVNDKASALATAEQYLARYPKGRFVPQATFRRCELLIGTERLDTARTCLEPFRTTFATDSRATEALLLLATLARAQTRWSDAAALYRDYLAQGAVPRAEEATYQLAKSLTRGKLPGAESARADYLRQYPNGRFAEDIRAMTP